MGAEKLIPQAGAKECQPEQEADPADTEKCEASENGTKCVCILICVSVHISKRAYS